MDDERVTLANLRVELRCRCEAAGGQSAWARRTGFSASYVSDLLTDRREPSEAIANALGFVREVTFRKIAKGA